MRDVNVSLGFKNPTLEQKNVDVSAALLKELRVVCPVVTRFVTDVLSVAAADTKCRLNSSCFKICLLKGLPFDDDEDMTIILEPFFRPKDARFR